MTIRHAALALLGFALAVSVPAAASDMEIAIVRVVRPVSTSPAALRQLKRRIADAALEVCGASTFSASGVKDATVRSACWRKSYADAIAQMGSSARADGIAIPRPRLKEQP